MALSSGQLSNYMNTGKTPQRTGNASPAITPYGVFPCADGDIIIASANQSQFSALTIALGHPEWATDPRFIDNPARLVNIASLRACFAEVMCKRPRAHWEEVFLRAGVAAGPINDYAQAMAHPQVLHLKTRIELPHGLGKAVPLIANPIRFSQSQLNYRYAPPLLGEHTEEILRDWLGLDTQAIADLKAAQVIAAFEKSQKSRNE
jgi:crotonobetainyl-CoA:carnitine CoA-transferase CaiB-like acyl-CoA transferase